MLYRHSNAAKALNSIRSIGRARRANCLLEAAEEWFRDPRLREGTGAMSYACDNWGQFVAGLKTFVRFPSVRRNLNMPIALGAALGGCRAIYAISA